MTSGSLIVGIVTPNVADAGDTRQWVGVEASGLNADVTGIPELDLSVGSLGLSSNSATGTYTDWNGPRVHRAASRLDEEHRRRRWRDRRIGRRAGRDDHLHRNAVRRSAVDADTCDGTTYSTTVTAGETLAQVVTAIAAKLPVAYSAVAANGVLTVQNRSTSATPSVAVKQPVTLALPSGTLTLDLAAAKALQIAGTASISFDSGLISGTVSFAVSTQTLTNATVTTAAGPVTLASATLTTIALSIPANGSINVGTGPLALQVTSGGILIAALASTSDSRSMDGRPG